MDTKHSADNLPVDHVLAIAEKISALTTEGYLVKRANRGSRSKYEDVLA